MVYAWEQKGIYGIKEHNFIQIDLKLISAFNPLLLPISPQLGTTSRTCRNKYFFKFCLWEFWNIVLCFVLILKNSRAFRTLEMPVCIKKHRDVLFFKQRFKGDLLLQTFFVVKNIGVGWFKRGVIEVEEGILSSRRLQSAYPHKTYKATKTSALCLLVNLTKGQALKESVVLVALTKSAEIDSILISWKKFLIYSCYSFLPLLLL